MGKSCWSLCHPYWHYTHDPGLRGVRNAALGNYSHETPLYATIPTIGVRSRRNSRLRGLGSLRQTNYKDEHAVATLATGPGMTGHVATIPKDRYHSLNSGAHARACSNSARSSHATPLQCRPRRHRIRPSRGLQASSPTRITPRANIL
jgi:hypothetical protein